MTRAGPGCRSSIHPAALSSGTFSPRTMFWASASAGFKTHADSRISNAFFIKECWFVRSKITSFGGRRKFSEEKRVAGASEPRVGPAEEPFEVDLRIAGVDLPHEVGIEGSPAVADLHEGVEIAADLPDEIPVGEPRRAQDEIEPFVVVVEVVASPVAGEYVPVVHGFKVLVRRQKTNADYCYLPIGKALGGPESDKHT